MVEPLFLHKPSPDDIQQSPLFGDCYLLATLLALINSPQYGPNFIINMMKDNNDELKTVLIQDILMQ